MEVKYNEIKLLSTSMLVYIINVVNDMLVNNIILHMQSRFPTIKPDDTVILLMPHEFSHLPAPLAFF